MVQQAEELCPSPTSKHRLTCKTHKRFNHDQKFSRWEENGPTIKICWNNRLEAFKVRHCNQKITRVQFGEAVSSSSHGIH